MEKKNGYAEYIRTLTSCKKPPERFRLYVKIDFFNIVQDRRLKQEDFIEIGKELEKYKRMRGMNLSICILGTVIGKCDITDEGVKHMLYPLKDYNLLEELYICISPSIKLVGKNKIGDEGMKTLLGFLKAKTPMIKLVLEDNTFGNGCMADLAEYLKMQEQVNVEAVPKKLQLLHIGGNKVDDNGALVLAEGLSKNITLTRFHIPHNSLTDKGAKTIIGKIPANLNVLNLSICL
eukprot:TRINITY_DN1814_c0_g1_i1.p2 TRINITY_DN1814_c0_g1~~TRINITY_DN1814_c0_g1_i1.p2  ORF type:complete len:261 (+),score=34.09 TRINITY_DN1814_c0_g1_i1:82-783(+)